MEKLTITEKIFSIKAKKRVKAGDIVIVSPDLMMGHDTTTAWALDPFFEISKTIFAKENIKIFFDHAYPSPNVNAAKLQKQIREFAELYNIPIETQGICHQVLAEKYIEPGMLVIGADSHTPTTGALGAIAIGIGSTDLAIAMATNLVWLQVPKTIRINVVGNNNRINSKDIILSIAKILGPEGGNYKAIEFGGNVISSLNINERLTITNMASELGAKCAVIEPDMKTIDFLHSHDRDISISAIDEFKSDKGCSYENVIDIDITNLKPQIALPHEISNVVDVESISESQIKVDQIFIGSCTNGRLEDLKIVYDILKENHVCESLRVIITPASNKIFLDALNMGYIEEFIRAGAIVTQPGCGACLGRHGGVLADDEVCLSTTNRNFQGRMGSPKARIFLCSPRTAAYSALTGYITNKIK